MNSTYLMVDSKIVPGIYLKVIEAKAKIASGKFKSANDAIREVGISRSTFYKYKDCVFACSEIERDKLVFFGGGVPLFAGDKLVGGLGISGGTGEEDDDIAQYALSVFEECCK